MLGEKRRLSVSSVEIFLDEEKLKVKIWYTCYGNMVHAVTYDESRQTISKFCEDFYKVRKDRFS